MKIAMIEFMQRKNKGNYEHEEIKVQAVIDENDNADVAMVQLKNFVAHHLGLEIVKTIPSTAPVESEVKEEVKEEVKKEEPKKEKATRTKKVKEEPKSEVVEEIPEVIKEAPAPVDKSIVKYDRMTLAHSSTLSSYLTKTYGEGWKKVAPPVEIKAFSESLNGQPFLDKEGNIVPSFKEQLATFFGPK